MATNALIDIEDIVSRYLFKYKLSTDDAFIYTEHACDAYRNFRLYDSAQVVTSKVTINANKWIDMPTDMQTFVDLCTPINGEWWSFSERSTIVNTTTFTGGLEGRDSTVGEGADLLEPRTTEYAASGGVNDYNYILIGLHVGYMLMVWILQQLYYFIPHRALKLLVLRRFLIC